MPFNAPVIVIYTFGSVREGSTCLCCTWMLLWFFLRTLFASNKAMKMKHILPVFIFNKPFRTKAAKLQFHSQFWETEVNRESDFPIANSSAILKRKSIPLPSFWQSTRISSYLCSLSLPPSSQNQDKEVDKSPQGLSWATAAKYRKQESAMELRGGGGGRKKDTDTSLSKHRLFSW